jgi:hypothetical protein
MFSGVSYDFFALTIGEMQMISKHNGRAPFRNQKKSSLYWYLVTTTIVVALMVAHVLAELRVYPLSQMVEHSELILIGKVIKLERNGKTKFGAEEVDQYRASIEVDEMLKGDSGLKEVPVYFHLHPEQPQFKIGERAVLFLIKRKDHFRVFNGIHGELPIVDYPPGHYKVTPTSIVGEPKEQSLDDFIDKIQRLVAGK